MQLKNKKNKSDLRSWGKQENVIEEDRENKYDQLKINITKKLVKQFQGNVKHSMKSCLTKHFVSLIIWKI